MSGGDEALASCVRRMADADKLVRDRALDELRAAIAGAPDDGTVCSALFGHVRALDGQSWLGRLAQMLAMAAVLQSKLQVVPAELEQWLESVSLSRLCDAERRVATAGSDALCSLLRRRPGRIGGVAPQIGRMLADIADTLRSPPTNGQETSPLPSPGETDAASARHHCECCMLVARTCAQCDPAAFEPVVDEQLVAFVLSVCNGTESPVAHGNFFFRSAGFSLLAALFATGATALTEEAVCGHVLSTFNAALLDPMAQMRASASMAARDLFASCGDDGWREVYLAALVPVLCFSRYARTNDHFAAVFQETWRCASNERGLQLVVSHLPSVVALYLEQLASPFGDMRENACHAVNELLRKVEPANLQPEHEPPLLSGLEQAASDPASCYVRSAAIAALASRTAVADCPPEYLQRYTPLYAARLRDEANDVRAAAADALTRTALQHAAVADQIVSTAEENLTAVTGVPPPSQLEAAHWHGIHGALLLVLDVLSTRPCASAVADALLASDQSEPGRRAAAKAGPLAVVARLCVQRDTAECRVLLATLCERLPCAVAAVGKARCKAVLQDVLAAVLHGCALDAPERTRLSSRSCLQQLATLFGPEIVRGRVEMTGRADYGQMYDELVPRTGA